MTANVSTAPAGAATVPTLAPLSQANFLTSPGHLRATAHLYAMETVPLAQARVLELGCSAGGNLLPFALAYPKATVVGIDTSPAAIAAGRQAAASVGASNLQLHAMEIEAFGPTFGTFDYILVHGLFTRLPADARATLLQRCREHLSPDGLVCISYPTYPGAAAADIVRQAVSLLSEGDPGSPAHEASARAVLARLGTDLDPNNPLAPALRATAQQLGRSTQEGALHRQAHHGTPLYVTEFIDAARLAGLDYVGDAEAHREFAPAGERPQAPDAELDRRRYEQWQDFATGRDMRMSLLTHADRASHAHPQPAPDRLAELRIAGHFRVHQPATATPGFVHYRNQRGRILRTREPAAAAVVEALTQAWPQACSLPDLIAATAGKTGATGDAHDATVRRAMQTLYRLGTVYIDRDDTTRPAAQTATPRALPGIVHLRQRQQAPDATVRIGGFNLWHDAVSLDRLGATETWILSRLGGRLTLVELRTQLREALQHGRVPDLDGTLLTGQRGPDLEAKAEQVLTQVLEMLWRAGLRVG